jgi:hypothetical protein
MKNFVLVVVAMMTLGMSDCTRHDRVRIDPDTCPLPANLANEDQHKVAKFAGEVTGITKNIGSARVDTSLDNAIKTNYPGADDVNKIYALGYTACVACRVNPGNVNDCADNWRKIIGRYTAHREESSAIDNAQKYSESLLAPLSRK